MKKSRKKWLLGLVVVGYIWLMLAHGCRNKDPESFFYAHKQELLSMNRDIQKYPVFEWISKSVNNSTYGNRGLYRWEKEVHEGIIQICGEIGVDRIWVNRSSAENGRELRSITYILGDLGFIYFQGTELTAIAYVPNESTLASLEESYYVHELDEENWYALIMLRDREEKQENGYEKKRENFKHSNK